MAREGLMDDTGYHGMDWECPERLEECKYCQYDGQCEVQKQLKGE